MSSQVFKRPLPYIAVILAHLIWGANFLVAKLTLQEIPVMSLGFLRFFLGLIFLIPFLLIEKKRLSIKLVDLPRFFVVGSLMITLNIALFYEGILKTTLIQGSVLTLIIPLVSVFIGWLFLKEKIYTINILGIVIALLGSAVVIGVPLIYSTTANLQNLLGNIFLIVSSICWVIGAALSKSLLKKYSTLDLTAAIFFVGLITFSIPALYEYLQNPAIYGRITILAGLGLLYIVFLSSITAYFLIEWGIARIGVIEASLFQYLEPVIASILGILILSETLRISFLIGAILIALGAYWGTLGKAEHHLRHRATRR